jgi:transcriptional regulator with GAF, ATPase, and Fis domain
MNAMADAGRFERLLAELSRRLSGLPSERLDGAIDWALAELTTCLETDRASLGELSPDRQGIRVTHSWSRPGVEKIGPSFPIESFPWYYRRIECGETVRIDHRDELPDEARAERAYMSRVGILSQLCVPLEVAGRWVCTLATATFREPRPWPEETIARVRVVGQILAGAIHRKQLEAELRETLGELRSLEERLRSENEYLREEIEIDAGFEQIVGRSSGLREVLDQAARVAPTDTAVLLLGETGTGKELLARALHARSRRSERPLVKVNCAALPPSLVESELFGHEKGAFTGATSAKPGRFELADSGTLFLDEVGELPLDAQAKLLRILEEGEFERVGGTRTRKVDVRILAATNRDLEREIAEGRFRDDLFYRLAAFPIRLPPLRERREDIPLIVWQLIGRRQAELGRRIEHVPAAVMRALEDYPWPGNIRELANVIERGLILSSGAALRVDASFGLARRPPRTAERLDDVERHHISRVLERCRWRINGPGNAAEQLGIHPNTLRSRMKRLGVARPAV